MGTVYRATFPNGKVYIGATVLPLSKRRNSHYWNAYCDRQGVSSSKFCQAIREFGKKNIKWDILHKNVPISIMRHLEFDEIEVHDSFKNGYNSSVDGRTNKGMIHTSQKRLKHSECMRGEKNPFFGKSHPEYLKNAIYSKKIGMKMTIETRKKMSISRMGNKNPRYGKPRTAEEKRKMSENKKKRLYRIFNTLTGEHYDVMGMAELSKWVAHHWNRSSRTFLNTKKFHCFTLLTVKDG